MLFQKFEVTSRSFWKWFQEQDEIFPIPGPPLSISNDFSSLLIQTLNLDPEWKRPASIPKMLKIPQKRLCIDPAIP